jgi:hypothetical protein
MIRKLPKKPKRETRFRSQRHLRHVRSHACVMCDAEAPIEAAHVRLGSDGGMGCKPSDIYAVALCGGPEGCHQRQHVQGERTFWQGKDVAAIIEAFIRTSPVRAEIEAHRRDNA